MRGAGYLREDERGAGYLREDERGAGYLREDERGAGYLREDALPGAPLQQVAVRRQHGEQALAGALAHRRPRVYAQVGQARVDAHPERVEGGEVVAAPRQLIDHRVQLARDRLTLLVEVVRDVPLKQHKRSEMFH